MPVKCVKRNGTWRIVGPDGSIETNAKGNALDGGGHDSKQDCVAQARAVNANMQKEYDMRRNYTFAKIEDHDEFTFVLAPVLVPETVDKHGDIIDADEIEMTAHGFLEDDGRAGLLHKMMLSKRQASIVESYLLRSASQINKKRFKKGTWMVGMKIYDSRLRRLIKEKKLKGFSVGGSATAEDE